MDLIYRGTRRGVKKIPEEKYRTVYADAHTELFYFHFSLASYEYKGKLAALF